METPAPVRPQQQQPAEVRLLRAVLDGSDQALLELSSLLPNNRIERAADHTLIIMPPTGSKTGNRNFELALDIGIWIRTDGTGLGFDSSTGFRLPNGAVRSADLAWVLRSRWDALTAQDQDRYAPLAPDFVLELRSPGDKLEDLEEKMAEFITQGCRLGWLLDPLEGRAHLYRPSMDVQVLDRPRSLSGETVMPGLVVDLTRLWV